MGAREPLLDLGPAAMRDRAWRACAADRRFVERLARLGSQRRPWPIAPVAAREQKVEQLGAARMSRRRWPAVAGPRRLLTIRTPFEPVTKALECRAGLLGRARQPIRARAVVRSTRDQRGRPSRRRRSAPSHSRRRERATRREPAARSIAARLRGTPGWRAGARWRRRARSAAAANGRVTSAITPKIASPVQSAGLRALKVAALVLGDLNLEERVGSADRARRRRGASRRRRLGPPPAPSAARASPRPPRRVLRATSRAADDRSRGRR